MVKKNVSLKNTLQALVDDYLNTPYQFKNDENAMTYQENHEEYLDSLKNFAEMICGLEGNEVGKLPYRLDTHQRYYRFPSKQHWVTEHAKTLKTLPESFKNFEELHEKVKEMKLHGFGPTTIYDFALRFGHHLSPKLEPQEYVYLHTGPAEAAKTLWEKGYFKGIADIEKMIKKESKIPRELFPKEIKESAMTTVDIEHFLCCYKKKLKEINEKK